MDRTDLNVIQRIQRTVKVARNAWRGTKATRSKRTQSVLLWPDWTAKAAEWNIHDLTSYVEEGFSLNSIIYSAIMYKVRAAYPAILRAMDGTRDEPEKLPADSELSTLLDRPNNFQSFPELQAEFYVNFNLFGNGYVWFKRQPGREFPVAFYNLRADRVLHLYDDDGKLRGFLFVPVGMAAQEGVPLLQQDVMHVRLPNPADPFHGLGKGMSPIQPLAQSADVDNAATAFLKLFFDQGTLPMGLLKTDQPIDDETASEARERWLDAYGNWQNWIEPIVLGSGIEYQRIGANFNEMDMESLDARNAGRIVAPFGVPLTLILSQPGLVQSTYSNKETDHKMFISNVLVSELSMFEQEWRYYLRSQDGTQFAQYDLGGVPGYFDQMLYIQNVSEAWRAGGATRAEYRKALSLPVSESDNVFMMPFTVQLFPAGTTPQTPQTERGAESAETGEDSEKALCPQWNDFSLFAKDYKTKPTITDLAAEIEAVKQNDRKLRLHNEINRVAVHFETPAKEQAQAAFKKDERAIMAIIADGQKAAYQNKQTVDWGTIGQAVAAYLLNDSKVMWRDEFAPVLASLVVAQGDNLSSIFNQPFDADNFVVQDWFTNYSMVFADPISATSEREIAALMQAAAANGWSVPQMRDNLQILFQQWIDGTGAQAMEGMSDDELERIWFATNRLPNWRSELIARVEMLRASNATSFNIYKTWGTQEKEWFSTPGPRTRPTHQVGAAWGQDPLVVPIDEPFIIGGSPLQYPGDPNGPLDEIMGCRCTVLPVL